MLPLLLLLVTTQVSPCGPHETTVVCACKQGSASACEALRPINPQLADALEKAFQAVKIAKQAQEQANEAAEAEAGAASSAPEPPNCKGQKHHVISKRIAEVLAQHKTLKGLYRPRDPRFVTQAKDEEAHCGYQRWHRAVDDAVVEWLERYADATPNQFERFLRELYSRPDLRARFPNGF